MVIIKKEEWEAFYTQSLKLDDPNFMLEMPCDPLPDENPIDTILRYLLERNIIFEDEDGSFWVAMDEVKKVSPNYEKFFEALKKAEDAYELDQLEESGLIQSGVDENGEISYVITEAGQKAIEDN